MQDQYVKAEELAPGVLLLTLNNPGKLNAINQEMARDLRQHLEEFRVGEGWRVAVITGAGNKSFSVGGDISMFPELDAVEGYRFAKDLGYEVYRAFDSIEKPIIAAVNGYAYGGGFELALACDLIVASENAQFSMREITLGLIPGWGGTTRLAKAVSTCKAKELIFTGATVTAEEALALGFVNKVVPADLLLETARELAEKIAGMAPMAVRAAKKVINAASSSGLEEAFGVEQAMVGVLFSTPEVREKCGEFLSRKKEA